MSQFEWFKARLPRQSDADILDVLTRLPDRYFEFFSLNDQLIHVQRLTDLSPEKPISFIFENPSDDRVTCTVITYNYPFLFSVITGLLSSNGMEIQSGEVFTYAKQQFSAPRFVDRRRILGALKRRKIVDFFSGRLTPNLSFRKWAQDVTDQFERVIGQLECGTDADTRAALQFVNRAAATRIQSLGQTRTAWLSPAEIQFDNQFPEFTRLTLVTEDTPFFLYTLSTALAHHDISIDHLTITTIGNRVCDVVDLTDVNGKKLERPELLDQLRLSVLLCKQFAFFLDRAPNPLDAISRFEQLVASILQLPEKGEWLALLANPLALQDMARLLGASDYLWEDFIRLHYEALLPVLRHDSQTPVYQGESTISQRLQTVLDNAQDWISKRNALNQFKDNEIFLMDLDHILEQSDLLTLSHRLTILVEAVVSAAIQMVFDNLIAVHGIPLGVGSVASAFAVFGLGKLGGAALGYASDIELMLVYSDNGVTDGPNSLSNLDFFTELVKELGQVIVAKRSGIFAIDLRLRPYGSDGPLAVSLENFCRYFGPDGGAHLYEKLALVRLRPIAGDLGFGLRVAALRDQFVYDTDPGDFSKLWALRRKQYEEKAAQRLNAKFSPGALVDIEYAVQSLQLIHGREWPGLRTPRIREALAALRTAGVLADDETSQIVTAYIFLRRLINGLRMLRGSAEDLFLPEEASTEYDHLARRMGYTDVDTLSAADQLHIEFETIAATVRKFVERYFSRKSLPSQSFGNVADLILNPALPEVVRNKILTRAGFSDPGRAATNLSQMACRTLFPIQFARLAVLACERIRHKPDPDMALNNWERFIAQLPSASDHFDLLLSQPSRLDILLDIFSVSQFLSDTLIRHPDFFASVTQKGALQRPVRRGELLPEFLAASRLISDGDDWRNRLRLLKRRELLRIAIKDVSLQIAMPEIYRDISLLAETVLQVCVDRAWGQMDHAVQPLSDRFCLLAMGKLGGTELNYSSDIDLIPILDVEGLDDDDSRVAYQVAEQVMRLVNDDVTAFTREGHCYRLDFTLRPFGRAGQWITPVSRLVAYYQQHAATWELQAVLKMRPIAGNWWVGLESISAVRPQVVARLDGQDVVASIRRMRQQGIRKASPAAAEGIDIKNGDGGIRDIEFWIQGLQLMHLKSDLNLWRGRSLTAMDRLRETGVLIENWALRLRQIYLFYRRLEHFLQVLDDQQTHRVPKDLAELTVLAKRLLGPAATADELTQKLAHDHQIVRVFSGGVQQGGVLPPLPEFPKF